MLALAAGIGCRTPIAVHPVALESTAPLSVQCYQGMVVAAEPMAAEAGLAMLDRGGNAIDAAVATGFALAVTYPVAGNLGGGGFLVSVRPDPNALPTADRVYDTVAIDFRETAPAAAHRDLYRDAAARGLEEASTLGPLAAGVPGSVAGMLHALEQWGNLDRTIVLAPAIRLAEEGFALPERTHEFLAAPGIAERMKRFPATAALFYPGGEPLSAGARLVQPELARTLRRIADHGRDGFYRGPVAEAIVAEMERAGGIMTLDDLRQYQPIERDPLRIDLRGYQVITMPPPSSGGVCIAQILGLLERWGWGALPAQSPQSLHLLAEAMRRSFADRNDYLGDPDHRPLPVEALLSRARLDAMAADVDRTRATSSASLFPRPPLPTESEETTHYSVIDAEGWAVSVTTTLNGAFGSKAVVPGAGFLLNNEMDDFATQPGEPNLYGLVQGEVNAVGPGRRPLSSMTPTIVVDRRGVRYVLGTPGGPTILTNVLQVLTHLVVHRLPPVEAVHAAKIHHQCWPDVLVIEPGFPASTRRALEARGHELRERDGIGDFQLIAVDPETRLHTGVADPRGGGAARGN